MSYIKKTAFTMIELVFVIVILGILAAVAIPRFSATRTDAQIAKARSDISTIRSAILTERQSRIIKGENSWISKLSDNSDTLFTGDGNNTLLLYGISSGTTGGHWSASDTSYKKYTFKIGDVTCNFTYDSDTGKFDLDSNQDATCDNLIK